MLLRRLPREKLGVSGCQEGSRLVDAFCGRAPWGERNALTKGPETWVLVLALRVKWKGAAFLSEPQDSSSAKLRDHNLTRLFEGQMSKWTRKACVKCKSDINVNCYCG